MLPTWQRQKISSASTSLGKVNEKEGSTADPVNTFAEWFCAGSTRITGIPIEKEDSGEVYNVSALTWDGAGPTSRLLVGPENARCRDPGGEYTKAETQFLRNHSHPISGPLWTKDDLIFITERYRLLYTFILQAYYWGGRPSTFFTEGFRYGVSCAQQTGMQIYCGSTAYSVGGCLWREMTSIHSWCWPYFAGDGLSHLTGDGLSRLTGDGLLALLTKPS